MTLTHGSESAILNGGTLTLTHCTLNENSGGGGGAGLYNQPGAILTVNNCTFANNADRGGPGGGIYNGGTATVDSCTFWNNSSPTQGGGIYNVGTLTLHNSIVAGNKAPAGPDFYGKATGGDYNLLQNVSGATLVGTHNIVGKAPNLGALQNNGGPTPTFALLTGIPAIDTGNTALTFDQRGISRPQGNADDMGAYEVKSAVSPVDTVKPVPAITTPTSNARIALSSFTASTITGTASDNVGVTSVTLKILRVRGALVQYWNGSAFTTTVATVPATIVPSGGALVNWHFNPLVAFLAALDSGAYQVYAYASDASGNTSCAAVVAFSTDTTAPAVQVNPPTSSVLIASFGAGTVTGNARDNVGVIGVQVRLSRLVMVTSRGCKSLL